MFAEAMATSMQSYETAIRERKRALFAQLDQLRPPARADRPLTIVELGMGTGPNLVSYPKRALARANVVGIEPNRAMWSYARAAAADAGLGGQLELVEAEAERLPLADASADAVVCTLVLCSVASQREALAEVRRVLAPGGHFFFIEHVLAESDPSLALQQRVLDGLQSTLADGCHVTRRTLQAIEGAGFAQVDAEAFRVPDQWLISPHIAGVARA